MIRINVLSSGSKGNACLINDGHTLLLLDAGISIKHIRRGTGFNVSDIAGCLITHEHQDHSKACPELARMGIDIYSGGGTLEALNAVGHRYIPVTSMKPFVVGTYHIMPFDVKHDAAEPLGYHIYSRATNDKLLYLIDTAYIRYKFEGLTYIIAECNHGNSELLTNVQNGVIDQDLAIRITRNHMSVERLINFLESNDLSKVKEIHLVHLSDNNSNEERFKQLVQKSTGVPVFVH